MESEQTECGGEWIVMRTSGGNEPVHGLGSSGEGASEEEDDDGN